MGSISVLGAIVILTGWFALIEFDQLPESERQNIIDRVKKSPGALIVIAFMPVGIILTVLGTLFISFWTVFIGATLIVVQSIIVSLLFWKRKRWKSIILLITMIILAAVLYIPLFLYF